MLHQSKLSSGAEERGDFKASLHEWLRYTALIRDHLELEVPKFFFQLWELCGGQPTGGNLSMC